jgi:hypothetical protein
MGLSLDTGLSSFEMTHESDSSFSDEVIFQKGALFKLPSVSAVGISKQSKDLLMRPPKRKTKQTTEAVSAGAAAAAAVGTTAFGAAAAVDDGDQRASTLPSARETYAAVDPKEPSTSVRPEDLVVVGGLGQGGFGVVVEVEARTSGTRLAMKCLSKAKHSSPTSRRCLAHEISMLTTMEPSPFLLAGHLAFETPFAVFIVTDLLSGGDLFFNLDRLENQRFPEDHARILLAEVCLGLVHLHRRGFVHLDVKIENIMLDAKGHVKLVDFGSAVALKLEMDSEEGMAVSEVGSLIYMAPELIDRKQRLAGRFSDWWAVGVLAHELMTAHSPWSSLKDGPVIRKEIASLEVTPPQSLSAEARKFLVELLQKDRWGRLGTSSDMDVLASSFFVGVDWDALERGELPPALKPNGDEVCVDKEDGAIALRAYRCMGLAEVAPRELVSCDRGDTGIMGLVRVATTPPLKTHLHGPAIRI